MRIELAGILTLKARDPLIRSIKPASLTYSPPAIVVPVGKALEDREEEMAGVSSTLLKSMQVNQTLVDAIVAVILLIMLALNKKLIS